MVVTPITISAWVGGELPLSLGFRPCPFLTTSFGPAIFDPVTEFLTLQIGVVWMLSLLLAFV
jgi:hypothetical protein